MSVPGNSKAIRHSLSKESPMSTAVTNQSRRGRINWTVLLWAVGVPLPIVLIVALLRGCS